MPEIVNKFDPWGPVSTVLYEINNADFVLNTIGYTSIDIEWHPLTKAENYSHATRIRAYRRDIGAAYKDLPEDQKGQFVQIVVKAMLKRDEGAEIRSRLNDALGDIGWTISEDGILKTQDALVSEQFFPPGSEYDAYITIRGILTRASAGITVVDAYIGASLLLTLNSLPPRQLTVRFLTSERNLKPDFRTEVATFKKQVNQIDLEIRTTSDFHDRFIVIDDTEFYHVGASIKDAGKRAFVISRIEDKPNIESASQFIEAAWTAGKVLQ